MSIRKGTVVIAGAGDSNNIDNLTITKNASNRIQASAVVNNNDATAPVYNWVGTSAEYTAQSIETLHPEWLCYITDDDSIGNAYTKEESDGRYVHLTGNETILGAKTFNHNSLIIKTNNVNADTTQSSFSEKIDTSLIALKDKNGLPSGFVYNNYATNGDISTVLQVNRNINNVDTSCSMKLGLKPDGTKYVEIPHVSYMIAPSSTYTTLTVGASGTSYTAPCDGWVYISATATTNDGYANITCMGTCSQEIASLTGQGMYPTLFVGKGQTFQVSYGHSTVNGVKFIHSISSII